MRISIHIGQSILLFILQFSKEIKNGGIANIFRVFLMVLSLQNRYVFQFFLKD